MDRNNYLSALICLAAGALYAAVPHLLLPVCEYAAASVEHAMPAVMGHAHAAESAGEQSHMVCFWTARAELGVGLLAICGGGLLLFARSVGLRLGVTLMLAATAVTGALIPTALIGVCEQETMPCRAGTLPGLLLLSALFFFWALLNARHLAGRGKAGRHA